MTRRALSVLLLSLAALALPAAAADKSETIAKAFPAPAGKIVLVEGGPLDVRMRSSQIDEIRIKVELSAQAFKEAQATAWIEAHRPTIEDGADQLRIVAPDPSGLKLLKGVIASKAFIELVVPPTVRPDLSVSSGTLTVSGEYTGGTPLRLRSASGEIEMDGWAPEVEVRSTSGDMTLRAARALDRLLARTASGALLLTGGARAARCDSSSGIVDLQGLLGAAGVATTSGKVTLAFDALADGDEVKVTTSSGRVRVTLPPGTQPGGELSSAKGEIRSVYAGQADPKGGRLQLAGSGPKLTITTSSGRIELN